MHKIIHLLFLPVLSMHFGPVEAQRFRIKPDSFLNTKIRNGELKGTVVVGDHGNVLLQKPIGDADFEPKKEVTKHTRFQFASISKTTTQLPFYSSWKKES